MTFSSADGANSAMQQMNGQPVDGREVRVDVASSQRR